MECILQNISDKRKMGAETETGEVGKGEEGGKRVKERFSEWLKKKREKSLREGEKAP